MVKTSGFDSPGQEPHLLDIKLARIKTEKAEELKEGVEKLTR